MSENSPIKYLSRSKIKVLDSIPEGNTFSEVFIEMLTDFISVSFVFIPGSFLLGGIFYTNIMFLLSGFMTTICMLNLIDLRPKLGNSLREMTFKAFNRKFVYVVDAFYFLSLYADVFAYICAVSLVFGRILKFLQIEIMWYDQAIILIIFFMVMAFSTAKNSRGFQLISTTFYIITILIFIYLSIFEIGQNGTGEGINFFQKQSILGALSTVSYSFDTTCIILDLYEGNLNKQEEKKFKKNIFKSSALLSVIIVVFGNIVYLAYASRTNDMVLFQFSDTSKLVLVSRSLYIIASWYGFMFSFQPLENLFKLLIGMEYDDVNTYEDQQTRFALQTVEEQGNKTKREDTVVVDKINYEEIFGYKEMNSERQIEEVQMIDISTSQPENSKNIKKNTKLTNQLRYRENKPPQQEQAKNDIVQLNQNNTLDNISFNNSIDNSNPQNNVSLHDEQENTNKSKNNQDLNERRAKIFLYLFRFLIIVTCVIVSVGSQQTIVIVFYLLEAAFKTPITFVLPSLLHLMYGEKKLWLVIVNSCICIVGLLITILVIIYYLSWDDSIQALMKSV